MKEACVVFDILHNVRNVTVFDQLYNVLYHNTELKTYLSNEDGDKVEDLTDHQNWIDQHLKNFQESKEFVLKAINFTSYVGALVHLDQNNEVLMPPLEVSKNLGYKTQKALEACLENFNEWNADVQLPQANFETASLQLFWLKQHKPDIFSKIKSSLSFAQYFQFRLSKELFADFTTVGCSTAALDFKHHAYHPWLAKAEIKSLDLPIINSSKATKSDEMAVGAGIYSKVAELQPFLALIDVPFILLSTGAWTVCLNPFNDELSSEEELSKNCFSILDTTGKRIKMARLFSGNEHSRQIQNLARHFELEEDHCLQIDFNRNIVRKLRQTITQVTPDETKLGGLLDSPFMERNLNLYQNIEEAYHQFIMDLVAQQIASIKSTEGSQRIRSIFVEGGLAKNNIFMELLSEAFHDKAVYKVGFEDTCAMGGAMVIGETWGAGKPTLEQLELELI